MDLKKSPIHKNHHGPATADEVFTIQQRAFVSQPGPIGNGKKPKRMPSMVKVGGKKLASGGEVSHLESRLRMRFPLRSSGKITFAYGSD
ncbi:hypothetical protein [Desulfoluna spongiiphila]|uniref:hypothetical protein n=1 Tax=Desulfoluna spongiiphila TaxID=419481 RepID=UPI00125F702B|nr:hypothetical protein [Desulfoluna spongiiphila]